MTSPSHAISWGAFATFISSTDGGLVLRGRLKVPKVRRQAQQHTKAERRAVPLGLAVSSSSAPAQLQLSNRGAFALTHAPVCGLNIYTLHHQIRHETPPNLFLARSQGWHGARQCLLRLIRTYHAYRRVKAVVVSAISARWVPWLQGWRLRILV